MHSTQEDTCVSNGKAVQDDGDHPVSVREMHEPWLTMGMPVSVLKEDNIFERVIAIKYDVPNDQLEMFDQYQRRHRRILRAMYWKRNG